MTSKYLLIKAMQQINKKIFYNKKYDIENTIVIAGAPRSGTTWLMEILLNLQGYSYIFEPLNPIWYPESFSIGFQSRTYIHPKTNWQAGEDYLKKIFSGSIVHLPIIENQVTDSIFEIKPRILFHQLFGNKLIVKSVNFTRLLPWIATTFPLRQIVLIIRHPCAVIASQLQTGLYGYRPDHPPYFDIFPNHEDILREVKGIDDLDPSLINRLKKIKKQEEILATAWCLDYYIPLSYHRPHPWNLVVYEKLLKDGEKEIFRLFEEIGEKKTPSSAYKHLRSPSMTTIKDKRRMVTQVEHQLSSWQKLLSSKQVERILTIVNDFGLSFYSEKPEPEHDKIIYIK